MQHDHVILNWHTIWYDYPYTSLFCIIARPKSHGKSYRALGKICPFSQQIHPKASSGFYCFCNQLKPIGAKTYHQLINQKNLLHMQLLWSLLQIFQREVHHFTLSAIFLIHFRHVPFNNVSDNIYICDCL